MVPERGEAGTTGFLEDPEPAAVSTMDAIVKGTAVGLDQHRGDAAHGSQVVGRDQGSASSARQQRPA
jgi:hypothetical protein